MLLKATHTAFLGNNPSLNTSLLEAPQGILIQTELWRAKQNIQRLSNLDLMSGGHKLNLEATGYRRAILIQC